MEGRFRTHIPIIQKQIKKQIEKEMIKEIMRDYFSELNFQIKSPA